MIIFSIFVSLHDIYCTVLTVDSIHIYEMNPIAKKIILFGKELRSYQGIAYLIWIKTLLLCLISSGATAFHYSKNTSMTNVLFWFTFVYFIENVLLLGFLIS